MGIALTSFRQKDKLELSGLNAVCGTGKNVLERSLWPKVRRRAITRGMAIVYAGTEGRAIDGDRSERENSDDG